MIKAVRKRFEPATESEKEKVPSGATTGAKTGLDKPDELRRRTIPEVPVMEDDLTEMQ